MPDARTLGFIGCRLLSLFILFQGFQQSNLAFALRSLRAEGPTLSEVTRIAATVIISYGLPFLILWFGAAWLSERMAGDDGNEAPQEGMSHQKLLSLGIALIGLFVVLINIPRAVSLVYAHLYQGYGDFVDLAVTLLALLMAVWCVIGAQSVAHFIGKLRRW